MTDLTTTDELFFTKAGLDRSRVEDLTTDALDGADDGEEDPCYADCCCMSVSIFFCMASCWFMKMRNFMCADNFRFIKSAKGFAYP